MDYNFREIEKKWQKRWVDQKTYRVVEDKNKKKFYVLNMFPYPSGAGLHVGHPLGYIASDIYAHYKRQQGFNVLNPATMPTDCLPSSMPSRQVSILRRPRSRTSTAIVRSWIRLVSASIGSARSAPATLSIISGRNGLSSACSRATIAQPRTRLSLPSS